MQQIRTSYVFSRIWWKQKWNLAWEKPFVESDNRKQEQTGGYFQVPNTFSDFPIRTGCFQFALHCTREINFSYSKINLLELKILNQEKRNTWFVVPSEQVVYWYIGSSDDYIMSWTQCYLITKLQQLQELPRFLPPPFKLQQPLMMTSLPPPEFSTLSKISHLLWWQTLYRYHFLLSSFQYQ